MMIPPTKRSHAIAAALALLASTVSANAGSGTQNAQVTTLKSSSGGTGMSKAGGNGGTGIPATANAPLGSLQSTFKPAHAIAPPPAGVRPHTDLAAAQKRTDLSSRSITKQSSLYNKIIVAPGDPVLVGAYMAKLAPKDGGAASVKPTPGISGDLSKSNVTMASGSTDSNARPSASLSSHGGTAMTATTGDFRGDVPAPRIGYTGVDWLLAAIAAMLSGAIGGWLWRSAPAGARMTLPTRLTA